MLRVRALRWALLAVLCLQRVVALPPVRWSVRTASGGIQISFDQQPVLSGGCPAFMMASRQILACDQTLYSTAKIVNIPQSGFIDPLLGNSSVATVIFESKLPSFPSVNLTVVMFWEPQMTASMQLSFSHPVRTNWVAPFHKARWRLYGTNAARAQMLKVSYDNDIISMYETVNPRGLFSSGVSNYVTTLYDVVSGKGLVIGFLDNMLWKNGIVFTGGHEPTVSAVCGVNGPLLTRDSEPHGMVTMTSTPTLVIQISNDWREGLEFFAQTLSMFVGHGQESLLELPAGVTDAPIAGYNTWATHDDPPARLPKMYAASDVLKPLGTKGFGPTQYINIDAGVPLNDTERRTYVEYARSNGQHAGCYMSPYVHYGQPESLMCGNRAWPVNESMLHDSQGNLVKVMEAKLERSNIYIVDPTSPYAHCIVKTQIEESVAMGFTFAKFDFINYAAYEGVRYNMTLAPTGMAAYTYALRMIRDQIAGRMIISYSMSLPFPHQYGHARRIGCDQMYGDVEFTLNQVAGGWWMGRLYTWLDADLVSFSKDFIVEALSTFTAFDKRSRVNKVVASGGLFLNGDDLENSTQVVDVTSLLGNPGVNLAWQYARASRPGSHFRPLHPGVGTKPPNVFVRSNGDILVFNYASLLHRRILVNLTEAGLNPHAAMQCEDVWDGQRVLVNGLEAELLVAPKSSHLVKCRNNVTFAPIPLQH